MSKQPATRASGFFIALAVVVGAVIGVIVGEPSAGTIIGATIGIVAALLLWLIDRRRETERPK